MSDNLVICYPDFPFVGTELAAPTAATGYSSKDLYMGSRVSHFVASSAGTSSDFDFDLGSGAEATPDHVILARANLLRLRDSASTTVTIYGDDNSSFTSPVSDSTTFDVSDLVGPDAADFVWEPTGLTDQRYWRVRLGTTASFAHRLGKLYLGRWFHPGREPVAPLQLMSDYDSSHRRGQNVFSITWRGVSTAKYESFCESIARYSETSPVFLYARSYNAILSGQTLIHARIVGVNHSAHSVTGHSVTVSFMEVL